MLESTKELACEQQRTVAAIEIMNKVYDIAAQAERVLSQMESKLESVTRPSSPCTETKEEDFDYPPLFMLLDNSLSQIRARLRDMQDVLNRTELEG